MISLGREAEEDGREEEERGEEGRVWVVESRTLPSS